MSQIFEQGSTADENSDFIFHHYSLWKSSTITMNT